MCGPKPYSSQTPASSYNSQQYEIPTRLEYQWAAPLEQDQEKYERNFDEPAKGLEQAATRRWESRKFGLGLALVTLGLGVNTQIREFSAYCTTRPFDASFAIRALLPYCQAAAKPGYRFFAQTRSESRGRDRPKACNR